MNLGDYSVLKMLHDGELAFFASKFARYGDSGRERFLRTWLMAYSKNVESKFVRAMIKNSFLSKRDSFLVEKWTYFTEKFDLLKRTINRCADMTDLERLQDIRSSWSESGVVVDLGEGAVAPDIMRIVAEELDKLVGGNIPLGLSVKVTIEHSEEIEPLQMMEQLQDYGFGIDGDPVTYPGGACLMITSARLCPLVSELASR